MHRSLFPRLFNCFLAFLAKVRAPEVAVVVAVLAETVLAVLAKAVLAAASALAAAGVLFVAEILFVCFRLFLPFFFVGFDVVLAASKPALALSLLPKVAF